MSIELLSGDWLGDLRGTLVGNLFATFAFEGAVCYLELNMNIDGQTELLRGVVTAAGESGNATAQLEAALRPGSPTPNVGMSLVFTSIGQGSVQGYWTRPNGNKGSFLFSPAHTQATQSSASSSATPGAIQIVTRTNQLPKLTLYRDEVKELVARMKALLPSSFEVVMSAREDKGKELRRLAPSFWEATSLPRKTNWLNLTLTEPSQGATRSITINLSPLDCSYSVSGPDELWVAGAFQEIGGQLTSKHSWWRLAFEKYALNLNGITLLLALALAPDLSLWPRLSLLFFTILMILLVKKLYDLAASVRVFLKEDFKERPNIDFPRLLTGLLSTSIVALITVVYHFLSTDSYRAWLEWLMKKN